MRALQLKTPFLCRLEFKRQIEFLRKQNKPLFKPLYLFVSLIREIQADIQIRFHNMDNISFTTIQAQETLEFLQLPVPQISHSVPTSTLSGLLFSLCLDPSINVSLQIEKLPIENARTKFLSDVFPQNIDLDYFKFEDDIASTSSDHYGSESSGTRHLEVMHPI